MRQAYMLAEAMMAVIIAGIVATVFTTMNYYSHLQSNLLKQQNSKTILEVVRSRLLNSAADPDDDAYFELLKDDSNALPVNIGLGTDAWGNKLFYAAIDLGTSDGTNAPYADSNASISPNANISGRLLSAGEDGIFQTTATDSTAQGDDLILEIGIGELNHYKLYGSSEITTQTRGYNSAIVSAIEPATPIHGALWYDTNTSVLKIYSQVDMNWTAI